MPGMTEEKKMHLEKGVCFGEGTVLGKEEKGKKQTPERMYAFIVSF